MSQYQKNNNVQENILRQKLLELQEDQDNFRIHLTNLRRHLIPVIIIFISCLLITIIYLKSAERIFRASTVVKIDPPKGNILTENMYSDGGANAGYISNEIEIIKSYYLREIVAKKLIDTVSTMNEVDFSLFRTLVNPELLPEKKIISKVVLTRRLLGVNVTQKEKLNAISISFESPSIVEAKLISNIYADEYINFGIKLNRKAVSTIREYLAAEKDQKLKDLNNSEGALQDFYKRTGTVFLEQEANQMISLVASYDAALNELKVDYNSNKKVLEEQNSQLSNFDPELSKYVQSKLDEPYFNEIQTQIAQLEVKRNIEISATGDERVKEKIKSDYDNKIHSLTDERIRSEKKFVEGLTSETPAEKKELVSKIFEAKLNEMLLSSKINDMSGLVKQYESRLTTMPNEVIELARIKREQEANEKLYVILQEKYQEAVINERSQLGNAYLLDPGIENLGPIKPKTNNIIGGGIIAGLVLSLGYAFARSYFDKSIKSPEELEKKGLTVLAWVPSIKSISTNSTNSSNKANELIVLNDQKSSASESFKALRTRVQFAKLEEKPLKTILVTSAIPGEGKTFICSNLAGSFALDNKKVVLVDCDLRKPRVHNVFKEERFPGLTDYFFSKTGFNEILRDSPNENLKYITSGTIPPNPSELLGSIQMKKFLELLKEKFDFVLIDSPPLISVTDSEILFSITDGTILVAKAGKTPLDIVLKSCRNLNYINSHNFLGCVLNDFNFKDSYGYYYNYYYYYSYSEKDERRKVKN